MFGVKCFSEKLNVYQLSDRQYGTTANIAVERGGILTRFRVNGREIIYLEEETLYDATKSVRGGCPILFPSCGRLHESKYTYEGRAYSMNMHGVARNQPWKVIDTCDSDAAVLKIGLRSNKDTLEQFPFDFELIYTYRIVANTLTIVQEITNHSDRPMPFSSGLHPYFNIDKKNALTHLPSNSYMEVWDDFSQHKFDGCMEFNGDVERIAYDLHGKSPIIDTRLGYDIVLDCSELYKYFVIWSPEGVDYACVEPWTALPNALNTKENVLHLKPNEKMSLQMKISVEFETE